MNSKTIEGKIRRTSKKQLLILRVLANSTTEVVKTSELREPLYGVVDESQSTTEQSIGGVVSAVARMRDEEGKYLLLPSGDQRWKLNTEVISKEELKNLVDELLLNW